MDKIGLLLTKYLKSEGIFKIFGKNQNKILYVIMDIP